MKTLATSAALLILLASPAWAQNGSEDKRVEKALRRGAEILLDLQEDYRPHRGPRVFRTDEALKKWQAEEKKRLEVARKSSKAPKEWPYEGVYLKGGKIPPGYRVGGTAIVAETLLLTEQGRSMKQARRKLSPAVRRGLEFILKELDENGAMAAGFSGRYDVRGWGHAYALSFFLRLIEFEALPKGALEKRVKRSCRHLIKVLEETTIPKRGGWNYARGRGAAASPFMTSSTLLPLYRAKAQGFEVGDAMIEGALDALEVGRAKDGNVNYSARSRPRKGSLPGAIARMSITETVLHLAGRSDQKRLRYAVDSFFEHWNELEKRRGQQGTHVAPYGVAPYYVYYGHTYVALAIELLPENDRPPLRTKLLKLIWKTQEKDGRWNDRIFPRSEGYSTAMVLQALMMPRTKLPPRWTP